jgi:hypothetical protein
MKNKEILILKNKQTEDLAVYNLIDDNYNLLFGNNIKQISYYEGFDLLLTSQYDVSFTTKQNLDWLIEILNPDQYEKVKSESIKTDILYKKGDKIYMLQLHDTNKYTWFFDGKLIWGVFITKFGQHNNQLFNNLTKVILKEVYNCKVNITSPYFLNIGNY